MSKSTKKTRTEGLDKFYTKPDISKKCINLLNDTINISSFDLIIEPSAGNGSFFKQLPKNTIGIDIKPECEHVKQMNFFEYKPPNKLNILVIGNPPFGKVNSLSIKFFNHAAKFSKVIAFIIPRTFNKESIQNRLDLNFHLIKCIDIPTKPCSFEPTMSVKCCFQIWEKRNYKREKIILTTKHPDWNFINYEIDNNKPKIPSNFDFTLLAYGGKCGEIKTDNFDNLNPKGWHFIKSNIDINKLISNFKKIDYSACNNTARQNSLGRGELVKLYSKLDI